MEPTIESKLETVLNRFGLPDVPSAVQYQTFDMLYTRHSVLRMALTKELQSYEIKP